MSFIELAKRRQSCRKYADKEVERARIERCIEAARLAPSDCNTQPWHFIVVDEPEVRTKVAQQTFGKVVAFNKFAASAPVLVVIVSEKSKLISQIGGRIKNKQFFLMDIGIAAEHFCLQASEEGLGTCMLGWFREKGVKQLLQVPDGRGIELIIAVGYPESDKVREKKRKAFVDIISYNKYE